jgi:hypothetical protein
MHGDIINIYKIFVRSPEGKGPFSRSGCRFGDNIKTVIKEMGCECGMDLPG